MSRRASLFAKENPGKKGPRVSFPDELVFLDNIKENDMDGMYSMLRRASVNIDINVIGDSGMTPLHQAVLDGNMMAVRLLIMHNAEINKKDEDSWTPLHAACAEGHTDIARFLLEKGANKSILTDEGERPIDLIDSQDFQTIALMLSHGRSSPPPRPYKSDEDSDEEEEDEREEEQEEEIKAPVPIPKDIKPLKSCLKKKLTIREHPAQEV